MPDFMVMLLSSEAQEAQLAPVELNALVEAHAAYEQTLRAASSYVDGARLRPSGEGKRVSARGGTPRVQNGPFDDPALAGYYVVRAETLDAATALATACPMAPGTILDVRPVMKGDIHPDKDRHQGRVFGFAVLGSAASEQGWIDVMNTIDANTSDTFPPDRWCGGVRLEAPGRGRRATVAGGQRAVFDGPFLESKEVIGGLFFLRQATLEEAVRWAQQSGFVKDGTLEIRELWRT
jgi:hypothetical protein